MYLSECLTKGNVQIDNLLQKTIEDAESKSIPIEYKEKEYLNMLLGRIKDPHDGVVLKTKQLKYTKLEDSLNLVPRENDKLWLALDKIQDPMNLGSIIRTCAYYGVSRIIVNDKESCPLSSVTSYASGGTAEWFPVYSVSSMGAFVREATIAGWNTIGTTGPETQKFVRHIERADQLIIDKPTVLVVGSEGYGLSDDVVDACAHLATINSYRQKMPRGFDSLNVSVATAVMLHMILSKWVMQERKIHVEQR